MIDLATAPFADIVADHRRRTAQEPTPLTTHGMLYAAAEWANQYDDDAPEQQLALTLVTAWTRQHLDSGKAADWWLELRRCIERAKVTETAGPAWDERDIDWDHRATEALQVLAGDR